jgi:hypothetical protein
MTECHGAPKGLVVVDVHGTKDTTGMRGLD